MNFWKKKWQDLVLGVGQIIFVIGLLTSIFSHYKPAPITCVSTAITLGVFLTVYVSYKLWFAFIMNSIAMILWAILAVQVIR